MARTGISYLDVEKAALQAQGHGKTPTVDSLRAILGTGSRTTISTHLKTWKAKQADGTGKLPAALTTLVAALWERLQVEANQQIDELRQSHEEERQAHQKALHQIHQAFNDLQKKHHTLEEAYASACQTVDASAAQLLQLQQTHANLLIREQSLTEQLTATQTENQRLHQLAQQMQANLAHYQSAIETLRLEQTLAFEKQQAIWQAEISALKDSLADAHTQGQHWEKEAAQHATAYQALQTQHQQLTEKSQAQKAQQKTQAEQLATLIERCIQQQKVLDAQQQDLIQKNDQLQGLMQQRAILSDQIKRAQKALQQAEDKIEALRHEKLFLIQEKAELTGYIRTLKEQEVHQILK
jgi:chromosome segregation ATPase